MRISIIMIAIVSLVMVIMPTQTALACSGGARPNDLDEHIRMADYVVKATVVQADDLSINIILSVETYLAGGNGPQHILLHQADISVLRKIYRHNVDPYCSDTGTPLPVSTVAYFMLERMPDGTYYPWGNIYTVTPNSFPQDVSIRMVPNDYEKRQSVTITDEAQFIDLVAELSGESPDEPEYNPLPFLAPLRVTTDNGMHYILPIDGQTLVEHEPLFQQSEWSSIAYPALLNLPPFCSEVGCYLVV
jgi:hypothetical protein